MTENERPDTEPLRVIADWLVRTLPGHDGAEQTKAAIVAAADWIDARKVPDELRRLSGYRISEEELSAILQDSEGEAVETDAGRAETFAEIVDRRLAEAGWVITRADHQCGGFR